MRKHIKEGMEIMAIQINDDGMRNARALIRGDKIDYNSDWSFTTEDEDKILGDGDWAEYRKWFLAIDTEENEETKARYKFPFGKDGKVYRRAVIAAKQRASQQDYPNIRDAADELLQMIDNKEGNKKIQTQMMFRTGMIEPVSQDQKAEEKTARVIFSTEAPVQRWFGYEILDHSPESVRMDRIRLGGAVLLNHDDNQQIGVIENATISGRKGVADIKFSKNRLATEVWQDIKDGIKRFVSVGYFVHEMSLESERDGAKWYRATDWEPIEVSIVAVPADTGAVIQQNKYGKVTTRVFDPNMKLTEEVKRKEMADNITVSAEEKVREERNRVNTILTLGEQNDCIDLAKNYVKEGKSIDEFKTALLNVLREKAIKPPSPEIGMTEKEVKSYRFLRVINALATNDWRGAEFERECSEAVARQIGKKPSGAFVPYDVMTRDLGKDSGSFGTGGKLIETSLLATNFIEMLRNRMLTRQLGAMVLDGLVGDVAIPRQTGGAGAYWVAENIAPTESMQVFDQVLLSPKTVGAFTDITRKLLLQSSLSVENLVRRDLATILALAIDAAAIAGTGNGGQPTGIISTTGVNTIGSLGTDGGPLTWASVVQFETETSVDNADIGNLYYLTNPRVRGKLKNTFKVPTYGETPIWENGDNGFGLVNGYPAAVSTQVPGNYTKGAGTGLSAMIFGNFADLIIAEWGALDLMVDPYTGSSAGTLRVRALQDVDVAVRHPESFCISKEISTT